MRTCYEMNPFLRRDDIAKWRFLSHESSATINKSAIVTEHVQDRRLGVKLAQAGVNAYSLWFAQQDVPAGMKGQFFRTGAVAWTTAAPVGSPVYLSDATPGAITTTKPASNAIIVGHVIDTNEVFLDLVGAASAESTAVHLPETTYWVSEAGDTDARQFDTPEEAVAQAIADHPAGTAITIMGDGATQFGGSTLVISNSHPIIFRNFGILAMNNWTLGADSEVYFYDSTLIGLPALNNTGYARFQNCVFGSTGWTASVSMVTNATTVYIEIHNCVGSPFITQNDVLAQAGMDVYIYGSQFTYTTTRPNFIHLERGTVTLENCAVTGLTNAEPPFTTDIPSGQTGAITLNECIFTYQTGKSDGLVEVLGAITPTLAIEGGRYKLAALGPGVPYTTNSLPFMDIGDRSGAAAAQDLAGSLRPTYECGRSVATFSPATGVLFGHQECLEFSFATAPDDSDRDGTNVASGAVDVLMPDGEIWFVTAYRVQRLAGTINADRRYFTVYRNGGSVFIDTGALPTADLGTSVGNVDLVPGAVGGSFKVVNSSNTGYDDRVTLVVNTALYKGAL